MFKQHQDSQLASQSVSEYLVSQRFKSKSRNIKRSCLFSISNPLVTRRRIELESMLLPLLNPNGIFKPTKRLNGRILRISMNLDLLLVVRSWSLEENKIVKSVEKRVDSDHLMRRVQGAEQKQDKV